MTRRICFIMLLVSLCLMFSSCETVKGTTKGFFTGLSKDVENTCDNIVDVGRAIKCADEKFQENFW